LPNYLLLGAGFSRNWGGWLASEAFEYLLGASEIAGNRRVIDTLWDERDTGGFEGALAQIRANAHRNPANAGDVLAFESALVHMFNDMNAAFTVGLDFRGPDGVIGRATSVSTFLTHFDCIFTLNQDVLLERHYIDRDVTLLSDRRLGGSELPGMRPHTNVQSWADRTWMPVDVPFTVDDRTQPYFKLHGSSNWVGADGRSLLIMGGAKAHAIGVIPVLQFYFEEFERRLRQPDARLMVIGYGFADSHINEMIIAGIDRGLKLFVVSPDGAGIAKARNPRAGHAGYRPSPLEDAFRRGLVGASRRELSATFGSDPVERQKLTRFLGV
jgi:hypothetical protein